MARSVFMADVTLATFETEVIERSHDQPVLVDFWAAWCGPCRALMPILARLADEYQGRFFLAKVNSDEQQDLAGRYGVRSLPTVKLFRAGAVVGEFLGVQPERSIRALLDRNLPRPSDADLQRGLDAEAAGDIDNAIRILQEAHSADATNDRITVHLGRLLLEHGRGVEGEAVLGRLSAAGRADPEIGPILTRLEFVRIVADAPPVSAIEQRVQEQPDDMQARYWLGARYWLAGRHEAALEQWLTMVRTNRTFGNDAGRRALLSAFTLLSNDGDLVRKYRNLLSLALN